MKRKELIKRCTKGFAEKDKCVYKIVCFQRSSSMYFFIKKDFCLFISSQKEPNDMRHFLQKCICTKNELAK